MIDKLINFFKKDSTIDRSHSLCKMKVISCGTGADAWRVENGWSANTGTTFIGRCSVIADDARRSTYWQVRLPHLIDSKHQFELAVGMRNKNEYYNFIYNSKNTNWQISDMMNNRSTNLSVECDKLYSISIFDNRPFDSNYRDLTFSINNISSQIRFPILENKLLTPQLSIVSLHGTINKSVIFDF